MQQKVRKWRLFATQMGWGAHPAARVPGVVGTQRGIAGGRANPGPHATRRRRSVSPAAGALRAGGPRRTDVLGLLSQAELVWAPWAAARAISKLSNTGINFCNKDSWAYLLIS